MQYALIDDDYKILVEKPKGNLPNWEDYITLNLREVLCADEEWIYLAQEKVQRWAQHQFLQWRRGLSALE